MGHSSEIRLLVTASLNIRHYLLNRSTRIFFVNLTKSGVGRALGIDPDVGGPNDVDSDGPDGSGPDRIHHDGPIRYLRQ